MTTMKIYNATITSCMTMTRKQHYWKLFKRTHQMRKRKIQPLHLLQKMARTTTSTLLQYRPSQTMTPVKPSRRTTVIVVIHVMQYQKPTSEKFNKKLPPLPIANKPMHAILAPHRTPQTVPTIPHLTTPSIHKYRNRTIRPSYSKENPQLYLTAPTTQYIPALKSIQVST